MPQGRRLSPEGRRFCFVSGRPRCGTLCAGAPWAGGQMMSNPPHPVARQAAECSHCGRPMHVGLRSDLTLCRVCATQQALRAQYDDAWNAEDPGRPPSGQGSGKTLSRR